MENDFLEIDHTKYETKVTKKFSSRKIYQAPDDSKLHAVIPGVIRQVYVKPGQKIKRGEPMLVLEAMKMMNDLRSQSDVKIKSIHIKQGDKVAKGELLIEFEKWVK